MGAKDLTGCAVPDNLQRLNPAELSLKKLLGRGGFATVYAATYASEPVAAKASSHSVLCLGSLRQRPQSYAHPPPPALYFVLQSKYKVHPRNVLGRSFNLLSATLMKQECWSMSGCSCVKLRVQHRKSTGEVAMRPKQATVCQRLACSTHPCVAADGSIWG